ncbi:MAG: Na/Pi symporter [Bacteroidales bacterium]|nr:Na/Pi symporter [Bacteroidales bacterium]
MKSRIFLFVCISLCLAIVEQALSNDSTTTKNYSLVKAAGSGDLQFQVVNKMLNAPFRVQVLDSSSNPVINYPVVFEIISFPVKASKYSIKNSLTHTDSNGITSTNFQLGSKEGDYEISAKIHSISDLNFVVFKATARKSNWVFMLVIGLMGGLALFLLGMNMMSEGLQKSAGDRMRTILSSLTQNRFIAMLVGTFVTMVIQSSSATTVMLVSFVNSKLMKFKQTIGIILGAAIGTTITAQIIAFKLTDYALLMVAFGFAIHMFSKNPRNKSIGEGILGFGILFYGMYIMSESMYPLRSYEPFINLLLKLENPLLGILVGALFTALIQSSSAFIGILIILGTQNLLTLEASVSMLIGANLGTAITAILASLNTSRESKQVALAHTLFKVFGALILVWWIPRFTELIANISNLGANTGDTFNNLPRQIANAHTVYNVLLTAIFLPFANSYSRFINFILPVKPEKRHEYEALYLDENLLKTPSLALNVAKQEVLEMIKIVRSMVEKILTPFMTRNTEVLKLIESEEKRTNFARDAINNYLLKITRENVDSNSIEEAFQMMYTVKEFEQIADIVSSTLKDKALSWCTNNYDFSTVGKEELIEYHTSTLKLIDYAYDLYQDVSLKKAKNMKKEYEEFRLKSFNLEKHHYERLKKEVEQSLASSNTHLELMTMFKLIGSHATNTARILLK